MLSALAMGTTRIRLGTMMTNAALRHPALLARQALTVDHISGGRLNLGVGAGYAESDFVMLGTTVPRPAERLRSFEETVQVLDRLLRGEAVTYQGRHVCTESAAMRPASTQTPRPPLTLAAHGNAALRVAARHADVWNSFGGYGLDTKAMLEVTRQRNQRLDGYAAAAGRDPATIRRSLLAGNPQVTPDPIWDSVEAFRDFVGRYREVGIDEFIFYFPPDELYPSERIAPGIVERIAQEILPELRKNASA
jgi:alkanesulfonate monooxygenase SsuD/methylene tetrahydromethanopterin reductase-like flavin-dependent oxidoreductase (luciferase family)